MDAAHAADQSRPDRNLRFRRHWRPPPLRRRRPALGGTGNGANIVSSSKRNCSSPENVAQHAIAGATRRAGLADIMRRAVCCSVGTVLDTLAGCRVPPWGRT